MNDADQSQHDAPLPPVYLPKGKVALKEAVIRLAERRDPSLPIRRYLLPTYALPADPLRTLGGKLDPYAWPVAERWDVDELSVTERVKSFIALVNAREEMRQALAEQDLQAVGQIRSGELVAVKDAYWRTDDGGNRLRFTDQKDDYEQVFFEEKSLSKWLDASPEKVEAQSPTRSTMAAGQRTRAWLVERWDLPGAAMLSKSTYRTQANQLFSISSAGFDRAWKDVIDSNPKFADFNKPGRKPGKKLVTSNRLAK